MAKKVYFCDPDKNKNCGKQGCYLHGNECAITKYKEFAREGDIPQEQAMIILNALNETWFKSEDDLK